MSGVDPEVLKKWKAGLDAHNLFVLEERRNASYRERFNSLTMIWKRSAELALPTHQEYDMSVNDTWQRLRKAYFERHG